MRNLSDTFQDGNGINLSSSVKFSTGRFYLNSPATIYTLQPSVPYNAFDSVCLCDVKYNNDKFYNAYIVGSSIYLQLSGESQILLDTNVLQYTPTISISISPGNLCSVYYFKEDGIYTAVVSDTNSVTVEFFANHLPGHLCSFSGYIFCAFVKDGGIFVSRILSGSIETSVSRIINPMTVIENGYKDFSIGGIEVNGVSYVYVSYNGAVYGIKRKYEFSDFFVSFPSDLSSFKLTNLAFSQSGEILMTGLFKRIDPAGSFSSPTIHCLTVRSKDGNTFSVDEFSLVHSWSNGTSERFFCIPDFSSDKIWYTNYGHGGYVKNFWSSYRKEEDIESFSLSETGFAFTTSSNTELNLFDIVEFEVFRSISIGYGEGTKIFVGVVTSIEKNLLIGQKSFSILCEYLGSFLLSRTSHPFYLEIIGNTTGTNAASLENLYVLDSSKKKVPVVIDFWNSGTHTPSQINAGNTVVHETPELNTIYLDYPVVQSPGNFKIDLFGWSRSGQLTSYDGSISGIPDNPYDLNAEENGSSVVVVRNINGVDTDIEIQLSLITTKWFPQTHMPEANPSGGSYPISLNSSEIQSGDKIKIVRIKLKGVNTCVYYLERIEVFGAIAYILSPTEDIKETEITNTLVSTTLAYKTPGGIVVNGTLIDTWKVVNSSEGVFYRYTRGTNMGNYQYLLLAINHPPFDSATVTVKFSARIGIGDNNKVHGLYLCNSVRRTELQSESGIVIDKYLSDIPNDQIIHIPMPPGGHYSSDFSGDIWSIPIWDSDYPPPPPPNYGDLEVRLSQQQWATVTGEWTISSPNSTVLYIPIYLNTSSAGGIDHECKVYDIKIAEVTISNIETSSKTKAIEILRNNSPLLLFSQKPYHAVNFFVGATFLAHENAWTGVFGLASDTNNYYVGRVSSDKAQICRCYAGNLEVLSETNYSPPEKFDIGFLHNQGIFKLFISTYDAADDRKLWSEILSWSYDGSKPLLVKDIAHSGIYALKSAPEVRITSYNSSLTNNIGILPGYNELGSIDNFPDSGIITISGVDVSYSGKVSKTTNFGPYQYRNTGIGWNYTDDGLVYSGNSWELTKYDYYPNSTHFNDFNGYILASNVGVNHIAGKADFSPWITTYRKKVILRNRMRVFSNTISGDIVGMNHKGWLTSGFTGCSIATSEPVSFEEGDFAMLKTTSSVVVSTFYWSNLSQIYNISDYIRQIVSIAGSGLVLSDKYTSPISAMQDLGVSYNGFDITFHVTPTTNYPIVFYVTGYSKQLYFYVNANSIDIRNSAGGRIISSFPISISTNGAMLRLCGNSDGFSLFVNNKFNAVLFHDMKLTTGRVYVKMYYNYSNSYCINVEMCDKKEAAFVDMETTMNNALSSIFQQRIVDTGNLWNGYVRIGYLIDNQNTPHVCNKMHMLKKIKKVSDGFSDAIVYGNDVFVSNSSKHASEFGFRTGVLRMPDIEENAKIHAEFFLEKAERNDVAQAYFRYNPSIELFDRITIDGVDIYRVIGYSFSGKNGELDFGVTMTK